MKSYTVITDSIEFTFDAEMVGATKTNIVFIKKKKIVFICTFNVIVIDNSNIDSLIKTNEQPNKLYHIP